ncbi:MAG: hypothetical protein B7X04_00555 [Parcubacteria group bacterium 21-54-25]|nr:MAG: hypothetical protein B7X04_00555 [Parcubacteria group bacterium 21-54-25]HQU07455.1 glycosyltransferase family 4 protein [Candidatus Paceibacterota bacterium]
MKLLIVTQAVDQHDPVLGFFVQWIEEFARHAERVEVICLRKGEYHLLSNVRVHSLGKERSTPRFARRLVYASRFLRLAWRLRHGYDTVFVHMNPEYLVIAGWLWRLLGKRTALWYTHKSVNLKLRIAVFWARVVFTASKESFRLPTKKLQIVGHGIDVAAFVAAPRRARRGAPLHILTIGRLAPSKRLAEMLAALDVLHREGTAFSFTIAGVPATRADEGYERAVRADLIHKPYARTVTFLGAVSHASIPALLAKADVFVNLSTTGSMDKAVLEALAAGVPAVTTNEAFRELLEPAGLFVKDDIPEAIAAALRTAATTDIAPVSARIRAEYALPATISRITAALSPGV